MGSAMAEQPVADLCTCIPGWWGWCLKSCCCPMPTAYCLAKKMGHPQTQIFLFAGKFEQSFLLWVKYINLFHKYVFYLRISIRKLIKLKKAIFVVLINLFASFGWLFIGVNNAIYITDGFGLISIGLLFWQRKYVSFATRSGGQCPGPSISSGFSCGNIDHILVPRVNKNEWNWCQDIFPLLLLFHLRCWSNGSSLGQISCSKCLKIPKNYFLFQK